MKEDKVFVDKVFYVAIISIILLYLLGLTKILCDYTKLEEEKNILETELIETKTILESYTDVGFGGEE